MKLPHQKYLQYLYLQDFTYEQVQEECSMYSLVSPKRDEWGHIISQAKKSRHWKGAYNPDNGHHTYKVKSLGLQELFHSTTEMLEAKLFLSRSKVRKDFEVLSITIVDLHLIRKELLNKYPVHFVPSLQALETFCSFFWNLGLLSSSEVFDFLGRHHGNKSALIPASVGDVSIAHARIGISEEISPEMFYNNIISFANTQVTQARMAAELLSGSHLMGIAAITRQGIDAMKAKEDMMTGDKVEILDTIREQAAAFHVRMDEAEEIITLEELEETDDRPALTVIAND